MLDLLGDLAAGRYRGLPTTDPLAGLVDDCLAHEPARRPADAAALAARIRGAPDVPARVAWVPVALASGLGAVVVSAAVALVVVSGVVLSSGGGVGDGTCTADDGRVGYARTKLTGLVAIGRTVVLEDAVDVLADPADASSVACRLPAGTEVQVRERVRKGWLAVYGDAFVVP